MVFKNNIFYAVMTSILKGLFGLLLALVLNRALRSRNVLRTLFFLPMVISNLIVGLVFQQILHPDHGILNQFLTAIGLGALTHGWIIEPETVMGACVAIEVWKAAGFNFWRDCRQCHWRCTRPATWTEWSSTIKPHTLVNN